MSLPNLLSRSEIHKRLPIIFPEGTPHRGYCIRELAASTVFAALYVGAIEGSGIYFGPKHVYRMTDRQASRADEKSRGTFASRIMSAGFQPPAKMVSRQYARTNPRRDIARRFGCARRSP